MERVDIAAITIVAGILAGAVVGSFMAKGAPAQKGAIISESSSDRVNFCRGQIEMATPEGGWKPLIFPCVDLRDQTTEAFLNQTKRRVRVEILGDKGETMGAFTIGPNGGLSFPGGIQ